MPTKDVNHFISSFQTIIIYWHCEVVKSVTFRNVIQYVWTLQHGGVGAVFRVKCSTVVPKTRNRNTSLYPLAPDSWLWASAVVAENFSLLKSPKSWCSIPSIVNTTSVIVSPGSCLYQYISYWSSPFVWLHILLHCHLCVSTVWMSGWHHSHQSNLCTWDMHRLL